MPVAISPKLCPCGCGYPAMPNMWVPKTETKREWYGAGFHLEELPGGGVASCPGGLWRDPVQTPEPVEIESCP